jgi:hypothetical protein
MRRNRGFYLHFIRDIKDFESNKNFGNLVYEEKK